MEIMSIEMITTYGIQFLIAVVLFIVGKKLAKWLTDTIIQKLINIAKFDETLTKFLSSAIYGLLLTLVVITALSQAGVKTTSFIAIIGTIGLAIGLAFKDNLSNLSSGVMIIIFRPIKTGEFVDVAGVSGTVEEINVFHTIMTTPDNKMIIVGNSKIISNNIINYSRKETRRVDLVFGISYEDNIKTAKDIILNVLANDDRVINSPAEPFVAVKELADSSVNLVARAWVKRQNYWGVYFATIENVKIKFDEAGISIPYPQIDVHTQK
jgi:small conductance mechanosensitive channel